MMTRDEAQKTLLLYRPGTADAAEPEIAEALALAQTRPGIVALAGSALRATGNPARKNPPDSRPRRFEGTNHF